MSTSIKLNSWPKNIREHLRINLGDRAENAEEAIEWCFGVGRLNPDVQRYIAFLKNMMESFQAVAELFDLWSPPNSEGKKNNLRLSNPDELIYIANHLYILDSDAVPGIVLECGCAHGFSSACLSIACAALGRELVVADSFEGLPPVRSGEPFFRQGDYSAGEEEVLNHISLCGRRDAVRTIKGWYSESLAGWTDKIAILWMDVDLYESARDLLANVLIKLEDRGAIFTHEFTDFHGNIYPLNGLNVPSAIAEQFAYHGISYKSQKLCRYWGMINGQNGIGLQSWQLVDMLSKRLKSLDPRWRMYYELINSNTVKMAFKLKQSFMPWKR